MKKYNEIFQFFIKRKDYLVLLIFYLLCFVLLFSKNYSYFIHFLFLFLAILPFIYLLKDFAKEKTFKFFLLFSTVFFVSFFPLINKISFWGDEIGVIDFSRHSFKEISILALNGHSAVPPLDYLNISIWGKIISFINTSNLEFFLRIPYFFYHSLAAILFAFSVKKVIFLDRNASLFGRLKNKFKVFRENGDSLFVIIAFFTYFFNPLLFLYAMEVRFFAFSALGSVLTLYLYLTKRISNIKFLPLTLLFTLNSVFQFLIMIPYLILVFFEEKKNKKQVFLIGLLYSILGIVLLQNISIPDPVAKELSNSLIVDASKSFFKINFLSILNFVFFLYSLIIILVKKPTEFFKWFLILIFYFMAISIAAFSKRYFDFYVRHYIFVAPILIFILFRVISLLKERSSLKYTYLLFLIFTIPWSVFSIKSIINNELMSKDDFGAKQISSILKGKNRKVYIVFGEEDLDYGVYFFNSNTLIWYFDSFGIDYKKIPGDACEKLELRNTALVSIGKEINCSNGVDRFNIKGSEVVFSKD